MNREQLAKMIDQTLLKPNVTLDDLRRHCETALQYGFGAVAVNSAVAGFCAEILKGSRCGLPPAWASPWARAAPR